MKNLIKRSLLTLALLALLASNAMNNETNLYNNKIIVKGKLIDLNLKFTDGGLKVNVKDDFGFVLYNDTYIGSEFARKFDLTSLPNGNYYFEIEGQTKIITIPFKVNSSNVDFQKEEESIFYKPILRMDDDSIYISKVTFNNEPFKIELYDNDSHLLYKEELKGAISLERKLNISKLESGEYKFIMISENRVFEQIVKKKK